MKTIGLLGGTSWPSTFLYYDYINTHIHKKMGDYHSAKIILYSIDYHDIKQNYTRPDGWDIIPDLFHQELNKIYDLPIDCLIICNNTLHKAFDILSMQNKIPNKNIPVFHALSLSAEWAFQNNNKSVMLLGTKYTMQNDFFKNYFIKHDIQVITPDDETQNKIQSIQTRTSSKQHTTDDIDWFNDFLFDCQNITDSIVLGCTELPLLVKNPERLSLINSAELQCDTAINFVFTDNCK
jgi:aspartate racemase